MRLPFTPSACNLSRLQVWLARKEGSATMSHFDYFIGAAFAIGFVCVWIWL
jgi:hypothetical protein